MAYWQEMATAHFEGEEILTSSSLYKRVALEAVRTLFVPDVRLKPGNVLGSGDIGMSLFDLATDERIWSATIDNIASVAATTAQYADANLKNTEQLDGLIAKFSKSTLTEVA